MNGILPVDKPVGFTSFDVIAKLRGILKMRRLGHAGTLDPMATGVLPVFVGRATRVCDIQPETDKEYIGTVRLGMRTDTLDSTGTVTATSGKRVSKAEFETALSGFLGEILQTPPMYSAVQIGGRRLYDLAREGKTVERPKRKAAIYEAALLSADETAAEYTVRVRCSSGTYIRTLFDDIGELLGTYGTLCALRRTAAGVFTLGECLTLDEIQCLADAGGIEERLIPVERVFQSLPRLTLSERGTALFINGVKLPTHEEDIGVLAVYGADGTFLGVGRRAEGIFKCEKLFFERQEEK